LTAVIRAWEAMGSPTYPTKQQIEKMFSASLVQWEVIPYSMDGNGGIVFQFDIPPQGVAQILFEE
jgi:hypothetical protein